MFWCKFHWQTRFNSRNIYNSFPRFTKCFRNRKLRTITIINWFQQPDVTFIAILHDNDNTWTWCHWARCARAGATTRACDPRSWECSFVWPVQWQPPSGGGQWVVTTPHSGHCGWRRPERPGSSGWGSGSWRRTRRMSVSVTALKSSSLSRFCPQTLRVASAKHKNRLLSQISAGPVSQSRSILQGGTVVVFSIRQPGYLCTLTLFARADLWSCQLCVTRKFVCCEQLLCGTGVTQHHRTG